MLCVPKGRSVTWLVLIGLNSGGLMSQICPYYSQDFFSCISMFEVVPNGDRELRRVDPSLDGSLTDLGIISQVNGPQFSTILVIKDRRIMYFPQRIFMREEIPDEVK